MTDWENLFKDNGDGTITQLDEDLIWAKKDSRQELGKWLNWDEANAYREACNEQKYLGNADWRLPTKSEIRGLLKEQEAYEALFMNLPVKKKTFCFQLSGRWGMELLDLRNPVRLLRMEMLFSGD